MSDRPSSFASRFFPPLAAEAWRVIPWFAVGTLILFWIWTPLGWVGVALTVWCATLFREPVRTPPARPAVAVSPVDGLVTGIAILAPPAELNLAPGERSCVTIALGPWDSHMARAPAAGKLVRLAHGYGGVDGERLSFVIESDHGTVGIVLLAEGPGRRVRSGAREGEVLKLGGHLAMVLFAGEAEVYLPPGAVPGVAAGQRMVAGETILA